ncbi:biotin-dependent carboxyltransferase family protein [Rhizohabitans arisaemae]|uniref:5-oxoprolinase subunit C family protein n=1 Tax=Rhizohabitans arisaemae TaxID=2720610 RepID=UPI0024B12E9D|nr:biotin-dependent carboxyltransferase family protein [Rhizohabitans arisaemae]
MKGLEVLSPGPLTTIQDLGRPGLGALGVGVSGAADRASFRLANRLVANPEGAAGLEITLGGLVVRARGPLTVAVTGAACPGTAVNSVVRLPDGAVLRLGEPGSGLRTYLAVRGGIDVPSVLGSRSTDMLSGIGPDPVRAGAFLPVGPPPRSWPQVDAAPRQDIPTTIVLRVVPGPRDDWFTPDGVAVLCERPYTVSADSNRVGLRLRGAALTRSRAGELPTEGMVPGALQVPPSGQPTLLLVDHPVTGGYPVIGVVVTEDVDLAAQVRPGALISFQLR